MLILALLSPNTLRRTFASNIELTQVIVNAEIYSAANVSFFAQELSGKFELFQRPADYEGRLSRITRSHIVQFTHVGNQDYVKIMVFLGFCQVFSEEEGD